MRKPARSLSNQINCEGMSSSERISMANREKDKGNEVRVSSSAVTILIMYRLSPLGLCAAELEG